MQHQYWEEAPTFGQASNNDQEEYEHQQRFGLGSNGGGATMNRDSTYLPYGEESIAMGQTSYEPWTHHQPMEPLSNSPTLPYHPWSTQQEGQRTLHPMSSTSKLAPLQQESFSSSTLHLQQLPYQGSELHHKQRDYWASKALQPSEVTFESGYKLDMEPKAPFTVDKSDEQEEADVSKTCLFKYGLHNAEGKKTVKFWILILSFAVTVTLTALDMTMISTALPSIVQDLPSSTIAGGWVTSSYLLSVTAFQPMFGGLSCVIGRRWSVVLGVILFIGGSVMCGSAHNILFLVIGRGVQGVGGGGIQAVSEITVSDITTLRERGFFVGIFGLVFAIASFIAPVLGGYFSDHNWRWIFWLNIPVGAVALIMLIPTMSLPVPTMPLKVKLAKMDVVGNTVLLGSVISILIAVTDGGVTHPWSSLHIWVPMAAGMGGFVLFLLIEFLPSPLSTQPVLPLRLFSNRTACSAFLMTFLHGIATYGAIYALPLYFQSVKDEKPLKSAVSTFPSTAPTAPFAIVAGIVMAVTGKYKNLTFVGWALTCAGFGWMTRFQTGTSEWELIVAQIVSGLGIGILFAITLPPIQASLPIEELETATATYAFCRSFGAIWGIAITTSVLTASVSKKLGSVPGVDTLGLTGPTVLGYVESIKNLPEPVREQVRQMYADGLQKGFYAFMPVVVVGFACCFWMEELALPDFIREGNGGDQKDVDTLDGGDQQVQLKQQQKQLAEQTHFRNQGPEYTEKYPVGDGGSRDSEQDTTLVGSAEQVPPFHPNGGDMNDVVYYPQQQLHKQAQNTPEGYASHAFSYVPSRAPSAFTWDEKFDAQQHSHPISHNSEPTCW